MRRTLKAISILKFVHFHCYHLAGTYEKQTANKWLKTQANTDSTVSLRARLSFLMLYYNLMFEIGNKSYKLKPNIKKH